MPSVEQEEEQIKEKWLFPKMMLPYFSNTFMIFKLLLNHLKNPVILQNMAKYIYIGFGKLIQVTTKIDISNNTTTINFVGFPRHTT